MAKFKVGDIIHKIGEKQLRPFKIVGITEDGYYIIEDKGLYLDCGCDDLYELVTDETYRHYTQSCLFYTFLQPPKVKIELDEKKIRELLESTEMQSRFNFRDYLEQNIIESYLKRKDKEAEQ